MPNGKKIILYGAGLYGKLGLRFFGVRNVHCFVDSYNYDRIYLGKRVISFDELQKIHCDYDVVISAMVGVSDTIKRQCDSAGIPSSFLAELIAVHDFESDPKLCVFKDIHAGRRCFLIGNGPSLMAEDLNKIHAAGDISFACNNIAPIYPYTCWRPSYYVAGDPDFLKSDSESLLMYESPVMFVLNRIFDFSNSPDSEYGQFSRYDNVFMFNSIGFGSAETTPRFSNDASRCLFASGTVMYLMIQWAAYMGFRAIYLLGVDCSMSPHSDDKTIHFYDSEYNKRFGVRWPADRMDLRAMVEEWKHSYAYAETYSREHGFRIYNATRGGQLEVFERVCFDSLF